MSAITPVNSQYAWGTDINAFSNGSPGTAVWPTANLAIYMPLRVLATTVVKQLFYVHGAITGGNLDLGIYSEDWARLVSTGSTAVSASASVPITIDVTDTTLVRGRYYLAMAVSSITPSFSRNTWTAASWGAITGGAQEASAFPLPATATPALYTTNYAPLMGYTTRTEAL